MTLTVPINAIQLAPGSRVSIHDLSWQDFETILADLGEKRNVRVAYYQGTLEIMSPLAIHERPHRIIAHIVVAILEAQDRNWEDFGATTLKRPPLAGIEPDTCFYIQNAERVQGYTDLDLDHYPPPDLAIEADVTSITAVSTYQALRVPEVWVYRNQQLKIYVLETQAALDHSSYIETTTSPTFPNLSLTDLIPQLVQQAIEQGTSQMLREFKTQLR